MIIDYIFGILGLLALIVAFGNCMAASRADKEIEKIIKKGGDK